MMKFIRPHHRGNPYPKPTRRALMLVVALWFSALAWGCARPVDAPIPNHLSELRLSLPDAHAVGEPLTVRIEAAGLTDPLPAVLGFATSYGLKLYSPTLQPGATKFVIPAEATTISGLADVRVQVGEISTQGTLEMVAGDAIEPITPLVGARSIIADGEHWAMTVLIPFDTFGNPVPTGTSAVISALHPGNRLTTHEVETEHLLAWERIYSGTEAGRTTIAARVGNAAGPEKELLEIPDYPVSFPLFYEPENPLADGRQLLTLRTGVVQDEFGNIMLDGTLVNFIIETDDGLRSIPVYTLDGIAEVPVQSPTTPQTFRVRASVFSTESYPLEIPFGYAAAVGTFPLGVELFDDALIVTAGPILGELGQYVPDGIEVTLTLRGTTGRVVEQNVVADAGYAVWKLRRTEIPPDEYQLHAETGNAVGEAEFVMPEGAR